MNINFNFLFQSLVSNATTMKILFQIKSLFYSSVSLNQNSSHNLDAESKWVKNYQNQNDVWDTYPHKTEISSKQIAIS